MMNGTIITVAHFEISELFNIDETSFPHSYWPVTTWATGGACSALFILPLAEDFGTRPVFLITYLIFLCFLIPQAVSQSFAALVVTRFFAGGCVAILANTAAGVVGNLWKTEWSRSIPVSLYIFGYMSDSSMGPVMGAAIFHSLSWRWIGYMQLIWFGALFPLYYFFFYESCGDAILARRARSMRTKTEDIHTEKKTVASSHISLQGLIVSVTRPTGFVQCAIVIAECIGWSLNIMSRKLYFASASRNTEVPGAPIPEARLYLAVLGGVFGLSGGMFTYAWTSYSSIPWIAPSIGLGMVGAGSVLVVTGVSDYVVDAYSQYSGSAMGAVATGEKIFSAFLPLATMSLYEHLGFQWASTLLALISLVLSLVPTLMFIWGREVRVRSPFMNEMIQDTGKKGEDVV